MNKNKKIIRKLEHIERIEKNSSKHVYGRKDFLNKKNKKNFKMRNKFKRKFRYHPKIKKDNFEKKRHQTIET